MESELPDETIDDNSRWMFPMIRATLKDCGVDEMPGCAETCAKCKALEAQLDCVTHAAHMPDDYKFGLPSWINQKLYAAYLNWTDYKANLIARACDVERIVDLLTLIDDAERARDLEREAKDTLQASCNAAFARIAELETQLKQVRACARAWKRAAKWERWQISDYEAAMYYAMFHEEDMRVERDAAQARIDAMLAKIEAYRVAINDPNIEYLVQGGVTTMLNAIRDAAPAPKPVEDGKK